MMASAIERKCSALLDACNFEKGEKKSFVVSRSLLVVRCKSIKTNDVDKQNKLRTNNEQRTSLI